MPKRVGQDRDPVGRAPKQTLWGRGWARPPTLNVKVSFLRAPNLRRLYVGFVMRTSWWKDHENHPRFLWKKKLQQQRQTLEIVQASACEAKFFHFSHFFFIFHFFIFLFSGPQNLSFRQKLLLPTISSNISKNSSCLKKYPFDASCVFFVVCCAYTWWPASVQFLRSLLSAFFVSILFSARVLFSWQPFNCLDMCTCDRVWSWESVMIRPSPTALEKVPFSHTSAHVAELVVTFQGVSVGVLVRRWNLDGRTCAEAATVGNASGSAARREQHELQLSQLPKMSE